MEPRSEKESTSPPDAADASLSLANDSVWEAAVGKNSDYYLARFAAYERGAASFPSWNWAAFFGFFWWAIYRKLWGPAVVIFAVGLIVSLLAYFAGASDLVRRGVWWSMAVVAAIFANGWYYRRARKVVSAAKQEPDVAKQIAYASSAGGSLGLPLTLAAGVGFVLLAVLAYGTGVVAYNKLHEFSVAGPVAPRTHLDGVGVSFVTPDEPGWNRVSTRSDTVSLARFAGNESESYVIELDYLRSSCPKSEDAFIALVKKALMPRSNRFKLRSITVELDPSKQPLFATYHVLTEDYGAHKMPSGQNFALLEAMGFAACHPTDPQIIELPEYSYRYYPGHEDPELMTKGQRVMDQVMFTNR